jgi:hypothetical protein
VLRDRAPSQLDDPVEKIDGKCSPSPVGSFRRPIGAGTGLGGEHAQLHFHGDNCRGLQHSHGDCRSKRARAVHASPCPDRCFAIAGERRRANGVVGAERTCSGARGPDRPQRRPLRIDYLTLSSGVVDCGSSRDRIAGVAIIGGVQSPVRASTSYQPGPADHVRIEQINHDRASQLVQALLFWVARDLT